MTITIDIDDAALPAFDAYLSTLATATIDPVTKQGVVTPHYTGVEDFVRTQIATVVTYVTQNFSK